MSLLVLYLGVTFIGYSLGAKLRKNGVRVKQIGKIQIVAISLLVFVMGSKIGADREIVSSLDTIGFTAFILTLFILAGSLAAVFVVRKLLGFDKYGNLKKAKEMKVEEASKEASGQAGNIVSEVASDKEGDSNKEDVSQEKVRVDHTMTICIVVFVAAGIVAGYFLMPDWFIDISGTMITVGLSILLLFVGIDIGTEGTIVDNFKEAGWRIFVFPFANMIGTYGGALVACLFLNISVQDAFCVGSGFSWYTLAPAMLADYSVKVSAISFMHNVMRELLGILAIPVVANKIGYIEAPSLPGAAAMDVCLPIVERATKADIAVYSFASGVTLSIAAPIMVSFMMGI
ncbi:MAG: lysine exporter LysO family protein [Clostridiales bacterium]|nr:lysine exporter LysO family protein [Clostridiales bacterium]